MSMPSTAPGLPRAVWLLCLCQGLGLTVAVISVDVAALAGARLCSSMALSTVPYGLQFAAALVAGPTASGLMGRVGRAVVFRAAAAVGVAAGLLGALAVGRGSFALLCLAHLMLGTFLATANLFRFAALELAPGERRQPAMTVVMGGGVFAALLGPLAVRAAPDLLGLPIIQASYLATAAVAALAFALLGLVRMPPAAAAAAAGAEAPPPARGLLGANPFTAAVLAGAVGYGLMNLLMVAASIDMAAAAFDVDGVSRAIQVHVFFMFAPSFAAGWLIRRLGIFRFLLLGAGLQIAAALLAFRGTGFGDYALSLAVLAVAWNALYVGGSTLVGQSVEGPDRFRAQGINEVAVALAATAGALLSGGLLAAVGWHGLQAISIALVSGFALFAAAVGRGALRRGGGRAAAPARP